MSSKQKKVKDIEGGTTSTTGVKIDSKAKVHSDISKQQERQQTEEAYHEERAEEGEQQLEHTEKVDKLATREKKHRESYLTKRSFLDSKKGKQSEQPVFGGEKQTAIEKKIDFAAGPYLDTQIAGKIKHQGRVFSDFKTWLGSSAPITHGAKEKAERSAKASKEKAKSGTDSLTTKIEKTFGPSSRRR